MRNLLTSLVVLLSFTVMFSCQKEVSQEYGSPAKGSLRGNGGDCLPKLLSGSYIGNNALNDSNYIDVTVDVTAAGPYTITTDTVNGYYFKTSGTFANTGSNTVRLKGAGTPVNPGVNNFSVVFDSSYCEVNVTVLPPGSTGGPAVFTLVGSPAGCSAFNLTGSYAKDVTLDASHSITLNVNVTSPGTYNISTTTVNGYTFSGSGTLSVVGSSQQIKLQGSGKPAAVGTNNFTVTAGTSSCTFPVTVTAAPTPPPVSNDYLPIAANNWWSYDYTGGAPDSMILKINGTTTIGGKTYQKFQWSSAASGPIVTYNYRKDAATGYYYEGMDTTGFGPEVLFTTPALDVNFLRNTLTTGQTWNTDYNVTVNAPGVYTGPAVLRFKFTCVNSNATLTTNTGRTISNVYEISSVIQLGVAGQFQDASDPATTFFAKGVGQVKYRDASDPNDIYEEIIRYWQLN